LISDFCPPVFDGWSCFGAVPAGKVAEIPCPEFEHLDYKHESKLFIYRFLRIAL